MWFTADAEEKHSASCLSQVEQHSVRALKVLFEKVGELRGRVMPESCSHSSSRWGFQVPLQLWHHQPLGDQHSSSLP